MQNERDDSMPPLTADLGDLLQEALHAAVNLLAVYEHLPNCTRDNTFRQAFDRIAESAGYENVDHAHTIRELHYQDMSDLYRDVYEHTW